MRIADEVCGDNEQCLYDLSTTGSVDVAASTAGAVQAFNETLRQLVTGWFHLNNASLQIAESLHAASIHKCPIGRLLQQCEVLLFTIQVQITLNMPYIDNYRDNHQLSIAYRQQNNSCQYRIFNNMFTFSVPRCPFLEAPRDGWMTAGLFTEGTNISFHCNDRYYLEGPSYIMCLEGASWDNDPPVCKSEVENANT